MRKRGERIVGEGGRVSEGMGGRVKGGYSVCVRVMCPGKL